MFAVIAACESESRVLYHAVYSRELAYEVAKDATELGIYTRVRVHEVPGLSVDQTDLIGKYLADNNLW